jgi:hypothetical protein
MKWLTLLSATLLLGLTVQAQTGTVSGTITDASGAGVPSATVTLTNLGTAATRTAVTDNSGTYSIPQVPRKPSGEMSPHLFASFCVYGQI